MSKITAKDILKLLDSETPKDRLKAVKLIEKTQNAKLIDICAQKLKNEKIVQIIIAVIELLGQFNKEKYSSYISKLKHSSNSKISKIAEKYYIKPKVIDTDTISFDDLLIGDETDIIFNQPLKETKDNNENIIKEEHKNISESQNIKPQKDLNTKATPNYNINETFELNEDDLIDDDENEMESIITFSDNPILNDISNDPKKNKKKKKNTSKNSRSKKFISYFLILAILSAGATYYYFKIYKKGTTIKKASKHKTSHRKQTSKRRKRRRKPKGK